jgi:exodeoxyribonuclease-3
MKIATWNVNSIAVRLSDVLRWLQTSQVDVLCLQEIKCTDDKFPSDSFSQIGYESVTHGQKTYNGVAILSRKKIEDVQRGFPDDDENEQARLIAATIEGIRVVDVYIPNGSEVGSDKFRYKLDWLQRLRNFLDANCDSSKEVLLCGDFNVAMDDRDVHDPKAWAGKVLFSKPERAAMDYVKRWGFTDAFRIHNQEAGHYSWWDYRAGAFPKNEGLRIDHIWVSKSLAKRCDEVVIDKEPRTWEKPSDHTPVVALLRNEG